MALIHMKKRGYKRIASTLIMLRLITPLFVWINPFVMGIVYQLLDGLDYVFITNTKEINKSQYQRLDKTLDFYYLFILFIVAFYWGNTVLIGLFLYRMVGFIVVLLTKERKFFLLFPNIFEFMFNFYSFGYVYNQSFVTFIDSNLMVFLLVLGLVKMFQELYIHYFNLDSLFLYTGIVKREN